VPQIVSNLVNCFPFRRSLPGVEFLLLRRHPDRYLGGLWQPVTGGIEPGETVVRAALRELREETGVTPRAFWQIDFVMSFFEAVRDRITLSPCFAAEIAPSTAVTLNPTEHSEYRWLAADQTAAALIWPQQRHALHEILTEIITPSAAEPLLRVPL
jgi:8-oxo-dGTP pyrophosphatase MutT (NUDIX family)